jgi:hypothetical protein
LRDTFNDEDVSSLASPISPAPRRSANEKVPPNELGLWSSVEWIKGDDLASGKLPHEGAGRRRQRRTLKLRKISEYM